MNENKNATYQNLLLQLNPCLGGNEWISMPRFKKKKRYDYTPTERDKT